MPVGFFFFFYFHDIVKLLNVLIDETKGLSYSADIRLFSFRSNITHGSFSCILTVYIQFNVT